MINPKTVLVGNTYQLDLIGYRAWYRKNVPNGAFMFDSSKVKIISLPEMYEGAWCVGIDQDGICVGSLPLHFLLDM